ncbi:MAG: FecR family protein [Candidatus Cryptobacteroides sp.]
MNNDQYKELLSKYLTGNSSSEETSHLDSLLGEHPDADFDDYCRNIWATAEACGISDHKKSRMKESLLNRISVGEDYERRSRRSVRGRRIYAWSFGFAAFLLLAIVGGALVYMNSRPVLEYEVLADRGQKSTVILPDGSRVWLNSASRITYTSEFNRKNRNISLEGEAYFEVAKNKKIPFVVSASGMSVTAVGTEFNVRNYPDEPTVSATLVEGRVLACSKEYSTYLDFGQEAVMERSSGEMHSTLAADLGHLVPWRSSEILLSDESLEQLSQTLSRMYNLDVVFESEDIKNYTYTGLIRNNSLQNVLELVSNTSPVDYVLIGDKIVFSAR